MDLVVTHGNGPQIGLLAQQSASMSNDASAGGVYPLDVLGAESEGMIGYVINNHHLKRVKPMGYVVSHFLMRETRKGNSRCTPY